MAEALRGRVAEVRALFEHVPAALREPYLWDLLEIYSRHSGGGVAKVPAFLWHCVCISCDG